MKPFLLSLAFLLLVCISSSYAQTQNNSLQLQDMQLTNAPAFSLMDVSPSSIQSPTSTKAFSTSIVNAITQGNGIPQNYAVEFTPFWFTAHPRMTSYKFFGITPSGQSNPFSQARFVSLSLAIINKDSTQNIGKLGNHNAGFGARTTLIKIYSGRVRDSIYNTAKKWDQALATLATGTQMTRAQLDAAAASLTYGNIIKQLMTEKPLFSLDVAAATNLNFPSNSFNSNHISRIGFWANSNLALDLDKKDPGSDNYLTISALTRYIRSSDSLGTHGKYVNSNLVDLGLKTEFQFGNIALAYEYINRSSSIKSVGTTFKSVGLINYKIKEGLFLTGAFGQNFSTINNLITTIGINWGLSNGKEKIDSGQ
jgi:hypothetical protein